MERPAGVRSLGKVGTRTGPPNPRRSEVPHLSSLGGCGRLGPRRSVAQMKDARREGTVYSPKLRTNTGIPVFSVFDGVRERQK